jgi:hypothetical protein
MTTHRSTINKHGHTAIAKHFNQPHHNPQKDMSISILDATPDRPSNPIKIKEASWIAKLQTIVYGINERDEATHLLNPHTAKIVSHFSHSNTCWPAFNHRSKEIKQDNLDKYKRVILNK